MAKFPDYPPKISIDWDAMLVIVEFTFTTASKFQEFEEIKHEAKFQEKMVKLLDEYIRDHTDLAENTMFSSPTWESDKKRLKKTALYSIEPQLDEFFLHY